MKGKLTRPVLEMLLLFFFSFLSYFISNVFSWLASGVGKERKQKAVEDHTSTSLIGLLDNAELENTGDAAFEGVYTYIEAVSLY